MLDQALVQSLRLIRAGKYQKFFPNTQKMGPALAKFCQEKANESLLTRRFKATTFGIYDEAETSIDDSAVAIGQVRKASLNTSEVKLLQEAYAASDGTGDVTAWNEVFQHQDISRIIPMAVTQIASRTCEGSLFTVKVGGFYAVDMKVLNSQKLKPLLFESGQMPAEYIFVKSIFEHSTVEEAESDGKQQDSRSTKRSRITRLWVEVLWLKRGKKSNSYTFCKKNECLSFLLCAQLLFDAHFRHNCTAWYVCCYLYFPFLCIKWRWGVVLAV